MGCFCLSYFTNSQVPSPSHAVSLSYDDDQCQSKGQASSSRGRVKESLKQPRPWLWACEDRARNPPLEARNSRAGGEPGSEIFIKRKIFEELWYLQKSFFTTWTLFFVVWKPAFSLTCYAHIFTHICTHGILYPSEKNSFPFVNLVNFYSPFKILRKCFLTESSEALRQTHESLLICTK